MHNDYNNKMSTKQTKSSSKDDKKDVVIVPQNIIKWRTLKNY